MLEELREAVREVNDIAPLVVMLGEEEDNLEELAGEVSCCLTQL